MAKWKLHRQIFGVDEYELTEGEDVTVGRGVTNKIVLNGAVISRNHCIINVQSNRVLVTDLKSSNGTYINKKKLPPNTPCMAKHADIIGFGWTNGVPIEDIKNNDKFFFKLTRNDVLTVEERIEFISEGEVEELDSKLNLKRKLNLKQEQIANDVIISISDSDNDLNSSKRIKFEPENIEEIKTENDDLQFEAFSVKQENIECDECIEKDSESDEDLESQTWKIRLSQNSPGKLLTKARVKSERTLEESSYSQIDDGITYISSDEERNEDDDDLIYIPPDPPPTVTEINEKPTREETDSHNKTSLVQSEEGEEFLDDLISLLPAQIDRDEFDGLGNDDLCQQAEEPSVSLKDTSIESSKKAQMIKPLPRSPKKRSSNIETAPPQLLSPTKISSTVVSKKKSKSKSLSSKSSKSSHSSSSKRHISNSQKEERKRKLKELATKEKDGDHTSGSGAGSVAKATAHIKLTTSNRGAFLSDVAQAVVKPMRKESPEKSLKANEDQSTQAKSSHECGVEFSQQKKHKDKSDKKTKESSSKKKDKHQAENKIHKDKKKSESKSNKVETKNKKDKDEVENKTDKHKHGDHTKSKHKEKHESKIKESIDSDILRDNKTDARIPLRSLKPLTDSEESHSGKPVSKVEPLPETYFKKPKKSVRFSTEPPKVIEFQIEPGNKMNKKSILAKTKLADMQKPVYSLEKLTLITILRWNPSWLDEQLNCAEPPPILGHNEPTHLFHTFTDQNHYERAVGDLLLMEIWENLTQGYLKAGAGGRENQLLQMRVESMPMVPPLDKASIISINVNFSLPKPKPGKGGDSRSVPRAGEVLLVYFGPENARTARFFYVHAVRMLPSPPNNIYAFYTITFHATFTDKMKFLKPAESMLGKRLAYINNELNLFEAMEYLAGSPLMQAILKPDPRHFPKMNPAFNVNPKYTAILNESQRLAVASSVAAALGDRPALQMVQGPPGTGKSSVIMAIVMSYFYDEQERKLPNRGKILICATSNPAVDELVLRLLKIRKNLRVRFAMVRVGNEEKMHPGARLVSSQELAAKNMAAQRPHQDAPALKEEISHLEAKINMLTATAQNERDPVRVAYCQTRVAEIQKRIVMLRGGCGSEPRRDALANAERRIIELADIIVTTLASAHSQKLRGLRRRIALCIVDEAGQAIEPETLIPLTLDVTKLTLIGDPQQLPGYIVSQRAKQSGLGNSMFARIASLTEHWPEDSRPVVLLNQQYRMQPEIAAYPNRAFYAGKIVSSPANPRQNLPIPPYLIVNISSGDKGQVSGANEMEAWGVSRLVVALHAIVRPMGLDIAVITPYVAHRDKIKLILKVLQDQSDPPIEVNTVDSFQGQERDVVVVSLARSQGLGFLSDVGRMNVMLTRAKHALVVCLNTNAVMTHPLWSTLVEDAKQRRAYRQLPAKMCQPRTADTNSRDEILKYLHK